jgi:O-antigen/teichoic acid export membrane protein
MTAPRPAIKSNLFYNSLLTAINILYPVILFSYVSHVFGPEVFGKLNFAAAVAGYFVLVGAMSIAPYGSRELSRVRNDPKAAARLFTELISINALSMIVSLTVFLVLVFSVDRFRQDWLLFLITGLNIVFCGVPLDWVFQGTENYRSITIRNAIFRAVILVGMFVLVRQRDDYLLYAALSVAGNMAYFITAFVLCRGYVRFDFAFSALTRHIRPLLFLTGSVWTVSVYQYLDSVYLGFMAGERSVGLYTAGMRVNRLIVMAVSSVGLAITTRLSYYLQQNMAAEYGALLRRSLRLLIMLSLPAVVLLNIVAGQLIEVLSGRSFAPAALTLRLGTSIVFWVALSSWLNVCCMLPQRRDRAIFISTALAAVTNIIVNLLLVPRFHENGAAVANVCAEGVACLVLAVVFIRQGLSRDFWDRRLIDYPVLSAVCAVPVFLVTRLITDNALALCAGTACMGVLYFGGLFLRKDDIVLDGIRGIIAKVKKQA